MVNDLPTFAPYLCDLLDEVARAAHASGAAYQRRVAGDGTLTLFSLYRNGVGLDLTLMRRDIADGVCWSDRARLLVVSGGQVLTLPSPLRPLVQFTLRGPFSRLTGTLDRDVDCFFEASRPEVAAWLDRFRAAS